MDHRSPAWGAIVLVLAATFLAYLTPTRPSTAQEASPAVDPTVTWLEKERLTQEVQTLRAENERSAWSRIGGDVAALSAIGGVVFAAFKYARDRSDERAKRAEQRFQEVVEGLSCPEVERRLGAAVLLRTFLQPGNERFAVQVFDLAVSHLRLQPYPTFGATWAGGRTPLSRSIAIVFRDACPVARVRLTRATDGSLRDRWAARSLATRLDRNQLDARVLALARDRLVQLDAAGVWLQGEDLREADFRYAGLEGAVFRGATLSGSTFVGAVLSDADFGSYVAADGAPQRTVLQKADLSWTFGLRTNFRGARLAEAKLVRAVFRMAQWQNADLEGADLTGALLIGVDFTDCTIEKARSLAGTELISAKGLTPDQVRVCVEKGAYVGHRLRGEVPSAS